MHSLAIVGVSGYGGGEALRIAAQHPDLRVTHVYGESTAGSKLGGRFPALDALSPRVANLTIEPFDPARVTADVLIASLPTGRSRDALAAVPAGVKVVDVGGDHRHVDGWTYGLADAWPDRARGSTRVANPGCYPTAALLALVPLMESGLLDASRPVIVDAKSGVSGAGRGGGDGFNFSEVNESVHAYKPLSHGHEPEIATALDAPIAFVPHLVPMTRGLLATCYATVGGNTNDCVMAARALYADSPFVRVTAEPPRTKWASGSNLAFVHYAVRDGLCVATCAIDNLGKGAAGQAVQNANLMLGLDPAAGLGTMPVWP